MNVLRRAKLTFIPHGANQYRPHLTRRSGLTVLLLLVIGMQATYNLTATGSVLSATTSISATDLLKNTNEERLERQLPALQANEQLSKAALLKANDMMTRQYWAHVAPDGTTPWVWLTKVGYSYNVAGENLAKNFTTANAATAAWMASPDHRKNILSSQYQDVGFAVVDGMLNGRSVTLIVALYGEPVGAVAAATNATIDAPAASSLGLVARINVALESLTPAVMLSGVITLIAVVVALTAHFYRGKLPKRLRQSWYRHHGLIKGGGMLSLIMIVVFLNSGGQI